MKSTACILCGAVLHITATLHETSAFLTSTDAPSFFGVLASSTRTKRRPSSSLSLLFDGAWENRRYGQRLSSNRRNKGPADKFDVLRDEATANALLERVLLGDAFAAENDKRVRRLSRLQLTGRGSLSLPMRGGTDDESVEAPCLFLSPSQTFASATDAAVKCLPVPLSDNVSTSKRQLKLLSFAHSGKPISKSLFLTVSPLLTGRDGSLWDNLPWTKWTIDPSRQRLVDAAQNPVADKYHPGKRDAFERMNGKDWYGRSLSGGNLKARLEYWLDGLDDMSLYLENDGDVGSNEWESNADGSGGEDTSDDDDINAPKFDDEAASILARRILEVEKAEATMAVAEAEQKLAILRGQEQGDDDADDLTLSSLGEIEARRSDLAEVETALADIDSIEQQLQSNGDEGAVEGARSILRDFLAALTSKANDAKPEKEAPYRGAYGYTAVVDSPEEMFWKSVLPYRSPYDLLNEIISEQLNADVIGTALEDTSIFDGEVILGGAVVLRRRGRPKSMTIGGETIEMSDEDDDYGSFGVKEGELCVVDCNADEAIGLALASDLDVLVENNILQSSQVDAYFSAKGDNVDRTNEDNATVDSIPLMESSGYDFETFTGTEGETFIRSSQTMPQPPTTTDAFLDFFAPKSGAYVYNTDNPIQSLEQYDSLSIQDKGRLLLSLPSFEGRLPRPRVLREYENKNQAQGKTKGKETASQNPIDELLVPFIDESVRREYFIRDAEKRGDTDEANRLREDKSKRLVARERAAKARESGRDEEADRWDEEADLQASTRADVTQDEGEYSRFLDRDDWYERERLARAKRIDKKKFGTLLDGLE